MEFLSSIMSPQIVKIAIFRSRVKSVTEIFSTVSFFLRIF